MREEFECMFAVPEEKKRPESAEKVDLNGIHVSANAYYGYQRFARKEESKNDVFEYMETQTDDSGVQFNNFIAPEDRLECFKAANYRHQTDNRKRRWDDDVPPAEFKKRRQCDTVVCETNTTQGTQTKEEASLLEELYRETHGGNIYHWNYDYSL